MLYFKNEFLILRVLEDKEQEKTEGLHDYIEF